MRSPRLAIAAVATAAAAALTLTTGSAAAAGNPAGVDLFGPVHLSASEGHYVYVQYQCSGNPRGTIVQCSQGSLQSEITAKALIPLRCTGQLEVARLGLETIGVLYQPVTPGKVTVKYTTTKGSYTTTAQAVAQP